MQGLEASSKDESLNYDNRIEDNAERKRGGERLGLFTLFCLFIGFVVLHYFDHKEIAKKIKDLDERVGGSLR